VIGSLGSQLKSQNARCLGFVVMHDHVHAMIWFPDENQISLCLHKWKELSSKQIAGAYSRCFQTYWAGLEDRETVWQPRYYDFNVFSERKMHEKLEYMHNNPVRAGLVKESCDWPWSSARYWLQGKSVGIVLSWPP
jgi:putative transposase